MQRPRRPPLVSGLFVVVAASVGLLSQEVHLLPPVQVPADIKRGASVSRTPAGLGAAAAAASAVARTVRRVTPEPALTYDTRTHNNTERRPRERAHHVSVSRRRHTAIDDEVLGEGEKSDSPRDQTPHGRSVRSFKPCLGRGVVLPPQEERTHSPEVDLLEGDAAVDAVLRQPELVQHIGPAVFRVHLHKNKASKRHEHKNKFRNRSIPGPMVRPNRGDSFLSHFHFSLFFPVCKPVT
jgi:hypothetical protein